jgi:hypothetical protein
MQEVVLVIILFLGLFVAMISWASEGAFRP